VTTDALIRRHRSADAAVTVLGPDGPIANHEVTVAQRSHAFKFGCTGFDEIELANGELDGAAAERAQRVSSDWLELYNFATLPFYWGRFEPIRGRPDTDRMRAAARWFVDRGVAVKGHPLCWHSVSADWLLGLSDDEIVAAQLPRIRRDVADFAGLIDTWDVINEVVIMPVFDKYDNGISRMARALGRVGIVKATFGAARATNPGATLLLNDFDMSPDYEHLIEDCLEAGIRIDALGLQSHMHQGYWGETRTEEVLGRFSRFGLPIHFTENTLVSGQLMPPEIVDLNDYQVAAWPTTPDGEARQAGEIVRHYRTLLAHPAVAAIIWWEIQDGGWLNAPTGLIRADGTRKPAYDALHGLIKGDWWLPPTPLITDETGTLRFNGFLGEYVVTAVEEEASFRLDTAGAVAMDVRLG
jgi:GH35 family endo-1,4-beta-xylanase